MNGKADCVKGQGSREGTTRSSQEKDRGKLEKSKQERKAPLETGHHQMSEAVMPLGLLLM